MNVEEVLTRWVDPTINQLQQENQQLRQERDLYKSVIDEIREYMKDFIFEPLLVNEDRKLIMFNENLRNFEKILDKANIKESDVK